MSSVDKPARIATPGTFRFMDGLDVVYTVGAPVVERALRALLCRSDGIVASDIETFGLGLDGRRLKVVSFSDEHEAVILDPRDPMQAELVRWGYRACKQIIFHNSPFDVPNLFSNGLIRLEDIAKIWDTLILARLAHPSEHGGNDLESTAARYLGTPKLNILVKTFKALGLSKKKGFERFDLDRPSYIQGSAIDPLLTYRLWPVVRQAAYDQLTKGHPFSQLGVSGSEAWDLVMREQLINVVLLARACKGYRVDFEYLEKYKAENGANIRIYGDELSELGIRPGVSQDLVKWLDAEGFMPPDHPKTETGLWSGNAKALEKIGHPVAKKFVTQKKLLKVQTDYLEKIVAMAYHNEMIHPTTSMLAAATGRASMADPPIHQLPPSARGIILFDEGDPGTSIDWSQIEPITMANACQDMQVIEAYESGISDVYTALGVGSGMLPPGTTSAMCEYDVNYQLYSIRRILKIVLLGILFGEGKKKLSADLGLDVGPYHEATEWEIENLKVAPGTMMPSYAEAQKLIDAVFQAMPKTKEFVWKLKGIARQYKKIVTVDGRILDIPSGSYNGRFGVQTHKGVNYESQGSAYGILADTLIRIIEAGYGDAIYFTMHDELIVSSSAAMDIKKIMETPPERLCLWAKRTPILRTDMKELGERWTAA